MSNLFLFLVLLSIVGLVVGLVKPTLFKQSRKKVSLGFGGAIVVFFVLFGLTSPSSATPTSTQSVAQQTAPVVQQPTFAQLAQKRFDDIKTSIPELHDIHCVDETCIAVVYFNFNTVPSDLETIIRGNAATFSKFEMDNSVGSHVSVIAQLNGKDIFQCRAADGKVTTCSN